MLRDYINIIRFNFNSLLFLFFSFFPFLVTRTIRIARSLYNNLDSGCKQLGDKRNKYRVIPPSPSMHFLYTPSCIFEKFTYKGKKKKKRKNLRISSITYFSSPRVSASLLDPLPLAALSTSRRNDQAPLRNADDRVGIGGWVLNHVLAVRKERKKKKNKRLSWTSKLEFPVDCRGKRRVYAVAAAIAISRGINQRARKREERGGSIAPSRDHLARFIRANSLSKRRSIPD